MDLWRDLERPDQIQELMERFSHFHDSCIREIHIAAGHFVREDLSMICDWRTTVHLLLQRQRRDPSAIELRFENVIELHLRPPMPDCTAIIFAATLFRHDGVFYWSDDADWNPKSSQRDESSWIAAQRVCWRDTSQWMGEHLRYRNEDS